MSNETNSGSGDAYGRAIGDAYKEVESASSPESEAVSSSSSEPSRQSTSKEASRRRSHVDQRKGKAVASDQGPRKRKLRSTESFESHRLNATPPPFAAVISTEIPMMQEQPGRDMRGFGSTTIVSLSTLERLSRSIPWPAGVELCLPEAEGSSFARYKDCLVIFEASVDAGFRLPLPDFYRDFLRLINLSPFQLYPNAWRYLSGYTIRCHHLGLSPNAQHMFKLFTLKYDEGFCNLGLPTLNVIRKPSNVGKWKNKWFLARCSSSAAFNCQLYPGPYMRQDKPSRKEINACKDQFRNDGDAPDHKRVITQENLEKAGLSLPRSTSHDQSSMKSDFLLKRAKKKKAIGSKEPVEKSARPDASEQVLAPAGDAMTVDPIIDMTLHEAAASLHSPGSSVEAGTQGDKGDNPSAIERGKKRSRADINTTPIAVTTAAGFASVVPAPSISDMKTLAPPDGVCVKEREWLTSLSPKALQLECMKYAEMTRLSMLASTTFSNSLEARCKRIREQCTVELSLKDAAMKKLESESAKYSAENAKLAEENKSLLEEKELTKISIENLQQAVDAKDCEVAGLKKERDDWHAKAERAIPDYIKSEDFMTQVAEEVGPHWELGIRVGVRQAVAKFSEIDPKISYFEPDYEDLCGETPIGDEAEDSQGKKGDAIVATTSESTPVDREVT